MKISIQTILVAVLLVLCNVFVQAQECVSMYFDSNKDGDDLVVQLKVDNFDNILISQFAFAYTYANLELIDIQGNSDIGLDETHVFADVPGYITVSWSNPSIGQTLADGSVLIEMRFTEVLTSASNFTVDPNYRTEFYNAFFEEICFQATPTTLNETRSQLIGNLYHDLNGNCTADPADLPLSGWTILIEGNAVKYYRVTDAFGHYSIPVETGNYTIEVVQPNDLWNSCEGQIPVEVLASGEMIENSFVVSPVNSSSALEVVVSSSEIKRCFDNVYSIRYKNNGTALAQFATIEFQYDENLEYVSSNTGNFSIDNNVITFDLGSVKPGDGGDFQVVLNANCDNLDPGQTLCVEAEISSSDVVIPPLDWNGAVLTTRATCDGDSVVFSIQNIGVSPMSNAMQSIVVEDDVMFAVNEVELDPQEVHIFKHAASGGVYRILIDQEDGYPLGNYSTDFVEFCNGGGLATFQYVSMFQNEDESPYRDIECQEVRDIADANKMSAFPIGYRADHLINQNEDIEYTVYFQNSGVDTVYNLIIANSIDESLNLETLVAGPSSHDYIVSITDERRLRIDFNNIQLPSANVNEQASKGFIKFRISQHVDVPIGTKINNVSFIFFDLEDAIETNVVSHTVGEQFIEVALSDKDLLQPDAITIAPNPAISSVRIELPETYSDLSYVLYDTKGRIISAANTLDNVFYIYRDFIQKGMYLLEIRSATKIVGTKKIVFQN